MLANLMAQWVPETLPPADEILRLDSRYPIVFLPVRIETRFALAQSTLKIRVYPDDIFGSTHEAELTEAEVTAGEPFAFLEREQTLEEWKMLIRGRTPQRAAWILEALSREHFVGKADSWTLPVETHLLPDRWIAVGYRPDGTTVTAVSRPIEEPLRLTVDPSSDQEDSVGDLPVEPELKWTVDFDAALAAGMGLEIPADSRGFDRLLVFGVKGSVEPFAGAGLLTGLFEDHRFSRGLALVRQGTPTNNTAGRDSGFPPDDQGGTVSYEVEVRGGLEIPGGDGEIFGTTLGIIRPVSRPFSFDHVAGANRREQASAEAMNNALWPVSFGYFLQHMLDPVFEGKPRIFPDTAIDEARGHFRQYVRGRGPCPAFRIGGVPYGVLPVSSLDRWKSDPGLTGGLDVRLPPKLQIAARAVVGQSQVGRRADRKEPERPRRRSPQDHRPSPLGAPGAGPRIPGRRLPAVAVPAAAAGLGALGDGAGGARQADLRPDRGRGELERPHRARHRQRICVPVPVAAGGPRATQRGLDAEGKELVERTEDQRSWTTTSTGCGPPTIDAIRHHGDPPRDPPPQALLYYVLRHALLTEYARLAYELLADGREPPYPRVHQDPLRERGAEDHLGPLCRERSPAETVPHRNGRGAHPSGQRRWVPADSFLQLANLSQAELERLFTETLDVASHRLDAWITSLFTKRLFADRRAAGPSLASYLGAFAWVEDLRPASAGTASGGFIHAPSPAHAATAAVLRSGFLTRKPEAAGRFAFDLSSDRVRVARGVLEAVRTGQPAGAVLGYRFERALHEAALDRFIDPLRRRFPLVANKAGQTADPPEAVAARSVVDGLALRLAWQTRASDDAFFADITITPPPTAAEQAALISPLDGLDAAVDGVADLLTAESVYQMVRGNAAGAAAPLDAMAAGAQPPDPDVARTPRGGIPATHRLLWLWEGKDPDPGPWSGSSTRRSEAEPVLDDWVGQILGSPEKALCWVTFTDASNVEQRQPISFAALKIRPLDVLELAQESPDTTQELRRRILQAAAEAGARLVNADIQFEPVPSDGFTPTENKTFPELLDLGRQVGALLARSRPGRPVDLLPLDGRDAPALSDDEVLEFDLARDIFDRLQGEDLDKLQKAIASDAPDAPDALRAALRRAAEYMLGAFPDPQEQADLLSRAKLAKAELDRRIAAAESVIDAPHRRVFSFIDTSRVLLGREDADTGNKTTPYQVLGRIAVRVAQEAVIVYAGYLDNEHGTRNPENTPTPFDSDAHTILISTGGVATRHDTGVLRFENRTVGPVTINPGLHVTTEQGSFQLWDSALPITLAPGQNLVLAETVNFNFDTSQSGLHSVTVVSGSVNTPGRPESALAIYQAIFGRSFLRLPRFTLAADVKTEIDQAVAGLALSPRQSAKFLQQNARVRTSLASWRKLWLYAEAGGAKPPTVDVAQLPFVPGEQWAGDDGVPAGSRLSLLLARTNPSRPNLTATSAAMVVDDWTEVIPNTEEQTGIAFHYDNPGAEAAQTILIAVRPDPAQPQWSLGDLTATLNETLDLAKVRAVEPEIIGETRQALPALYLTANVADEAISTDFAGLLQAEPVRVARRRV